MDSPQKVSPPLIVYLEKELSEYSVQLYWGGYVDFATEDIIGFEVQRSESSDGINWASWVYTEYQPDHSPLYVWPATNRGHFTRFRARSKSSAGLAYYSDWTVSSNILQRCTLPTPPTRLAVDITNSAHPVLLEWNNGTDGLGLPVRGYIIQYSDSPDNTNWGIWTELANVSANPKHDEHDWSVEPPQVGYFRKFRIFSYAKLDAAIFISATGFNSTNVLRNNGSSPDIPTGDGDMFKVVIGDDVVNGPITVINDDLNPNGNRLQDTSLQLTLGEIGTFQFVIYPNNAGYYLLTPKRTKLLISYRGQFIFLGYVVKVEQSMNESGLIYQNVTCEDIFAAFYDSYHPRRDYSGYTFEQICNAIISNHNQQVDPEKRFFLTIVEETSDTSLPYIFDYSTSFEAFTHLTDNVGGFFYVETLTSPFELRYYAGNIRDTAISGKIQLAENLKSLTVFEDTTQLVNKLYPIGARYDEVGNRIGISSVNDGKNFIENLESQAKYGTIGGPVIFDTLTMPIHVLLVGERYLANVSKPRKQYRLTVVDLARLVDDNIPFGFKLGYSYQLMHPIMDINTIVAVTSISLDLNSPQNIQIEFEDTEARFGIIANLERYTIEQLEEHTILELEAGFNIWGD